MPAVVGRKGVAGSTAEQLRLIQSYAGNPLALKIVAQTIVELFEGQVAPFLEQGEVVFGGVRALLDEQYARLSTTEQSVLVWLVILREPVTVQELLARPSAPLPRAQVLEAVDSLRRRSLIELGPRQGSFTLHSVVMEYVTGRIIAEARREIEQGNLSRFIEHGLVLAPCKEYVRQTQQRLLLAPILAGLRSSYPLRNALEEQLLALLDKLRERADDAQGYGTANLLALLREQRGHLRGLDLSHLVLRSAYARRRDAGYHTLPGEARGVRLDVDLWCHLGRGDQSRWTVLGGRQQARGNVGVGWTDAALDVASPLRRCAGARLQPGWTPSGQREL